MSNYFPNADRKVRLGRPTRYPWDEWTDGKERVLKEGDDFTCMAESFVLLARRTARVRGLELAVSTIRVTEHTGVRDIQVNGGTTSLAFGTFVLLKFGHEV